MEKTGTDLILAWDGESRLVYDVEHSLDLAAWTNTAPSRTGDGTRIQVPVAEILEYPNTEKSFFRLQTRYQENEEGAFQDMLTPAYYNADTGDPFRDEVNRAIYYFQRDPLHHPLQNGTNAVPEFEIQAVFGSTKGRPTPNQYHPAVDLRVGTGETAVELFAAHDGIVATYRDALKYREYLSISKTIVDDNGQPIGMLVTLYAHLDLDMDEAGGLFMDGQTVGKGDLVSRHLYSDTVGGPHLHFEMRYYRPGDTGEETFYGIIGANLTEPSAGPWIYGKWDPTIGYGFGDPKNHGLVFY
ncbi:MAG: M23 family metallopeptidase [Verrucomicrobiota bacterium]|nr:M23 family metallopeptidase [Verrucomicrobiota bacterium]